MECAEPLVVPSTRARRKKESGSVDAHSVPHTDKLNVVPGEAVAGTRRAGPRPGFQMTTFENICN